MKAKYFITWRGVENPVCQRQIMISRNDGGLINSKLKQTYPKKCLSDTIRYSELERQQRSRYPTNNRLSDL